MFKEDTMKYLSADPYAIAQTVISHDQRINHLEANENESGDRMQRIEDKLDSLRNWMLGAFAAAAGSLALLVISFMRLAK